MKIMTVEYRELKSFGNYNNESIGVVMRVEDGESPDQVLDAAKTFVQSRLGVATAAYDAQEKLDQATRELVDVQREIKRAESLYGKLKKLLKKHGVAIEPLPF